MAIHAHDLVPDPVETEPQESNAPVVVPKWMTEGVIPKGNVIPEKTAEKKLLELQERRRELGKRILELRKTGNKEDTAQADELWEEAIELDAEIKVGVHDWKKESSIGPDGKKRIPGDPQGGNRSLAEKPDKQVIRKEGKTSWSRRFADARKRMVELGQIPPDMETSR